MMSVAQLGPQAGRYYTQALEEGGERAGYWLGDGPRDLGLHDPVTRAAFDDLACGTLADVRLVRNAGPAHFRGWDVTLSAPKSFSVLWALSDEPRRGELRAALRAAVQSTVAQMEQEARTRLGAGGAVVQPVRGLVVAAFEHEISRPHAAQLPDPNLHVHLAVFNVAVSEDGKPRTLLGLSRPSGGSRSETVSPFYAKKLEFGAHFREELARGVERLGLRVERTRTGFEIEGVPPALCQHFSKRRAAIEAELARTGDSTAVAAARAALRTRERKRVVDHSVLSTYWRAEAKRLGFELAPELTRSSTEGRRSARDPEAARDGSPDRTEHATRPNGAQRSTRSADRPPREGDTPPRGEPRGRERTHEDRRRPDAAREGERAETRTAGEAGSPSWRARIESRGSAEDRGQTRSGADRADPKPRSAAPRVSPTQRALRRPLLSPVVGVPPISLVSAWRARRELRRDGVVLTPAERRKARTLTFAIRRTRELVARDELEKAKVLRASALAWRKEGFRVHLVTPSPETAEALRLRGLRAWGAPYFARGATTKRTWRDTFHLLRGDEHDGSNTWRSDLVRKDRPGGRVQFRSLSSFLRHAETTKNRTWFHFDRKTVLILDEPERMRPADLETITRRAHRGGATIVSARTAPPREPRTPTNAPRPPRGDSVGSSPQREPRSPNLEGRGPCRS